MNPNPLNIVILAAGKGTRMYSDLPKVLHAVGGVPMLTRVIRTAQSLNPERIVTVIGHGADTVRGTVQEDVVWVEQKQQAGTGDAVKTALPYLCADGRTLILYGDVPLIDADTLQALLQAAGSGVGILTDVLDNPTGYGRIVRKNGEVTAIVEEKDADAETKKLCEINTGIFVLPNDKAAGWLSALQNNNAQGEYYLTDVIAAAVRDGVPVHPLQVREHFTAAGVNNKIQLAEIERALQQTQAAALMAAGVTLRDPARFDLRGTLSHGKDVTIDINVILEGNVILGDRVSLGAGCVIRNAVIASDTAIAPYSVLDGCSVGQAAQIGPFARLRPGAKLENDVHIGNFVEVKNSTVGAGSKANHLTYLGDADIGSGSNIGAGTVTCNYDGAAKYRTVIGSGVRIGSGNMLVAPVTIGDKATTGAGSTIAQDCPPEKLTLARARQTTVENWQRPEKETGKP